jgi:hypothetical protein
VSLIPSAPTAATGRAGHRNVGQGYGRDGPYGGEGGGGHNAPATVYAPPPEEAVETLMVRQLQAHTCSSNCLVLSCHVMSCPVVFLLHALGTTSPIMLCSHLLHFALRPVTGYGL